MHRWQRGYCIPCDERALLRPLTLLRSAILTAALLFILALHSSPAQAFSTAKEYDGDEVTQYLRCAEPQSSSGGSGSNKVDDSNEKSTVYGSCPPKGFKMRHLETPAKSFMTDFNLNLYAPLYDKNKHWWSSPYSRGTPGNYALRSAFIGDDQPCNGGQQDDCLRMNAAYPQLGTDKKPTTQQERACLIRLQDGQAADQTIMSAAPYPYNNEEIKHIAWEKGLDEPAARMSPENHCQTFKKVPDMRAEYKPGDYIYTAYKKTLLDPTYRKGGSKTAGLQINENNSLLAWLMNNAYAAVSTTYKADEPEIQGLTKLKTQSAYTEGTAQKAKQITMPNMLIMGTNSKRGKQTVFDTTHPYTPRWDYYGNERDWGSPKGAIYSKHTADNVTCADLAKPGGSGACFGQKKTAVKVDILSFRWDAYVPPMTRRIDLNTLCWKNSGLPATPCCDPSQKPCKPLPCWKCFGLTGKTTTPPCSTTWDQAADRLSILPQYRPIKGFRQLPCGDSTAAALCEKLREPYVMTNQLIIRRSQCKNKKNRLDLKADGSCDSRGEGIAHTDYFSCRMPYPIQQDTGAPIRDVEGPANSQNPMDFAGQYASFVGVGRAKLLSGGSTSSSFWKGEDNESDIWNSITPIAPAFAAGSGSGSSPSNTASDERCRYGGWGKETDCMGMQFKGPGSNGSGGARVADSVTSWIEFKKYVANGIRKYNINCVMQYHKAFAPLNSTNKALARAGAASFERPICSKKNSDGTSSACDNSSSGGGGGGGSGSDGTEYNELRRMVWPAANRGQPCTPEQSEEDMKRPLKERICFPYFGAKKEPTLITGLDKARPGDILLLPTGGVGDAQGKNGAGSDTSKKPLLPSLAVVVSAHNAETTDNTSQNTGKPCSGEKNCHLIISSADDGQLPDVCGNTTYSGTPMNRTIYKPGMMPDSIGNALKEIQKENKVNNPNTYCENPQFGYCEMEGWDNIKIYRIDDDVREEESSGGTSAPTS